MSLSRFSVLTALLCVWACLMLDAQSKNNQPKSAVSPQPAAAAQPTRAAVPERKSISPEDQREIISLFKDVDPSKYRLEFNGGTVTAGTKKVEMSDLEQVRRTGNPSGGADRVILIIKDRGVMFILAVTGRSRALADLLGAGKAAQLEQIMAKYQAGQAGPGR